MTKLNAQGIPFGHTRIGIHAGEVIVGNFGGSTIFDYRALGDVVNTASRLEGANKYLGTCVCLSEAVLQGVSSAQVRPIGRLLLKGKTQALLVYEPLSVAKQTGYAPLDAYCAAWQLMTELLPSASAAFSALYAQYPNDPLVVLHCRRLDRGEQGDLIRLSEK